MIQQLKLTLKPGGPPAAPHINWGYAMYGIICEKAPPGFAEALHSNRFSPISQYVVPNRADGTLEWTLNLLGGEAIESVLPAVLNCGSFALKSHNVDLKVVKAELRPAITEREFCERHLLNKEPKPVARLKFITPTSFKTNGGYALFPSADLIINSLINKWNAYAKEYAVEDEDARRHMLERTRIIGYSLKSMGYSVKSGKIPAFRGDAILLSKGPSPLLCLFNLIMDFGNYSGMGIKASLGMGGCGVEF